jgi:hypothetical protein
LFTSISAQKHKESNLLFSGFFNFNYQQSSDKIFLEVDKIDKDFLYVNSLTTGLGSNDIGLDRGQLGEERIVRFKKYGNKLLLVQPNKDFVALSENKAEKNSVEQAFAHSVIFGFEILEKKGNSYIIDFTPFLLKDTHGVIKRLESTDQGTYMLDLSKSALELKRTKAFPNNVEFEALLTFVGNPKGRLISSVSPDPSNVSAVQHHSFIKNLIMIISQEALIQEVVLFSPPLWITHLLFKIK